ncbi:MAG: HDIG domain-containing protein [Anaerolineaceae bacterium]|nr:MAG: HDIG domain-containing protein [Anaerolineaceae bacterium]
MEDPSGGRPSIGERIKLAWQATRLGLIFAFGLIGTVIALSLPISQNGSTFILEPGDVAPQDILAPYRLDFPSDVLTEQARQEAAEAVEDIYDPPDSNVARQQLENLRAVLDYIDTVRADELSTQEEWIEDLIRIEEAPLDAEIAQAIIDLPDPRWEAIKLETTSVLEQVMRNEIREDRVNEARRSVPTLVSIALPVDQVELVSQLVTAFVAPNTWLNESATEEAKENARQSVELVRISYAAGETIVRVGSRITPLEIEALEAYNLLKPPEPWQRISIQVLLVTLLASTIALYAYRIHPTQIKKTRHALTVSVMFIIVALNMQLMIPGRTVLPYLFPAATLPILFAVLFSPGMGIMSALVSGALAGFLAPRGLELGLYTALSGTIAALIIGRAERLSSFFWAGIGTSISAAMVIVIFRFPDPATDLLGKATLMGAAIINGLLSASLGFGLLLLISNFLGITTSLQLIELSRPDHPLLQLLLQNAPGTYQHSLQVANLAEQAARAIEANPLLTRVGALYHDVGKALRPQFFIENQVPGQNVHEQLDPTTSASIIISHVDDGLELANKYRLPESIQAFIKEHHGNQKVRYQYHAAIEAAGGDKSLVKTDEFTYPGTTPHTRETAVLMLADGVEAKVRADKPQNNEEIDKLVRWVIADRLSNGQLARTDLTLKDLDTIRSSFTRTLRNFYHPRLQYPEPAEEDTTPIQDPQDSTNTPPDSS